MEERADKSQKSKMGFLARFHSGAELFKKLQNKRLMDQALFQSRDRISVTVAGTVFVLIASYLILIGWQREHTSAYLKTKKNITSFAPEDVTWHVSHAPRSACSSPSDCYGMLKAKNLTQESFSRLSEPGISIDNHYGKPSISLVRTTLRLSDLKLVEPDYLVVGMPSANYDKAYAFINGEPAGSYLLNGRIGVNFYHPEGASDDVVVDVLYESSGEGLPLFIRGDEEPLLVCAPVEYRSWVRMLTMQSARQGVWLSDMSFIVMAALFLMVFLFVDSSPEVLGLALFMGFEAIGRSFDYGWLPISNTYPLEVLLSGASDVMRIYYVVQICRLGSPNPKAWIMGALGFGAVISAGSWLRMYGIEFTPDYSEKMTSILNIIFSMAGVFVLSMTAYYLRGKGLASRQWALLMAAVACGLQGVAHVDILIPQLQPYTVFYQARSILLPLSSYLLAASAFINISTLENRVRSLSKLQAKNDEIEKELELGRLVQGAFMTMPPLPSNFDLALFYVPAFYVSGDAYFVDWDAKEDRLVVILGDMTGHGVQAALKATTMQTVTRTFFRAKDKEAEKSGSRFLTYKDALGELFKNAWGAYEIPTFIGVEIDARSGETHLYRSNFPFALLLTRKESGDWSVKVQSEREDVRCVLAEGDFIVFASDGIFDGSRRLVSITQELRRALKGVVQPSSEAIKNIILGVSNQNPAASEDDRSMIVICLRHFAKTKDHPSTAA